VVFRAELTAKLELVDKGSEFADLVIQFRTDLVSRFGIADRVVHGFSDAGNIVSDAAMVGFLGPCFAQVDNA
jgi:hypothetical protein